jgi:type II secretory pathway component PulF
MANSSRNPVIGWLTIVAASLSIAVSIGFSIFAQSFQSIFKQLGGELPLITHLIFLSSPWLWLGSVLSILVWFFYRRQVIPRSWSLVVLSGVIIYTIAYVPVGIFAMYQPMFKIFDLVR